MNNKLNPKDYIVDPDATVSNIDLDTEEFYYRGKRLTEADAEKLAEKVLQKAGRGRPSLTGKAQRSPQVAFRLPPELRAKAEKRAAREGKRVSEIAREALEHYLAS